jgi:hypothetical protein
MKHLATFVAAVFLSVGIAVAAEPPAKPITLEAKQGTVTFNHATHKDVKCEQCHKVFPEKVEKVAKDAAHGVCQNCHKEQKKGPQKCAECHKKA